MFRTKSSETLFVFNVDFFNVDFFCEVLLFEAKVNFMILDRPNELIDVFFEAAAFKLQSFHKER